MSGCFVVGELGLLHEQDVRLRPGRASHSTCSMRALSELTFQVAIRTVPPARSVPPAALAGEVEDRGVGDRP